MATQKPQILAPETEEFEGRYLSEALGDTFSVVTASGTLAELLADAEDGLDGVEVLLPFIHSYVGAGELAALPDLRLIALPARRATTT